MSPGTLHFRIEARPRAATLHVGGRLTVGGVARAIRLCQELPVAITELRVDLRAATIDEPASLQALAMCLVRWRGRACGRRSRIDLPPSPARPAPPAMVVARRFRAPRVPRRPRFALV